MFSRRKASTPRAWCSLAALTALLTVKTTPGAAFADDGSRIPHLRTVKKKSADRMAYVFAIAVGDIATNVRPYKRGLLTREAPALFAGLDYYGPWTRDAAINAWNGVGLLFPTATRNGLLSQLSRGEDGEIVIDGQYWDQIIWALGAWQDYLLTGDRPFLELAFRATRTRLATLEKNEFDGRLGLFRGPAVYGDGVSAYPDLYARTGPYDGQHWVSDIQTWPAHNPKIAARPGVGLPMHALSTNLVYAAVYGLLPRMAKELGQTPDARWAVKERRLRAAIERHFWDAPRGRYRYLVDPFGGSDRQEGLGYAFAILLGAADGSRARALAANAYVAPAGIPCLHPTFERYQTPGEDVYGRHSGTVWGFVQGFWGHAAARAGNERAFRHELDALTRHAARDKQFVEIYHPRSGLPYGGRQEANEGGITTWTSAARQTWSATGYLRLVLMGLFGMSFDTDGVHFAPFVPYDFDQLEIGNLHYRGAVLTVRVNGRGGRVVGVKLNGADVPAPFLPASATGPQELIITLGS